MKYNQNAGAAQPTQGLGRKIKRVSDVNAMGVPSMSSNAQFIPAPTAQPTYMSSDVGFANGMNFPQTNYGFQPNIAPTQANQPQQYSNYPNPTMTPNPMPGNMGNFQQQQPQNPQQVPQQFAMFQQPIVQDMAMQYGQRLADQGKQLVESQFEKWIPVTKLKYYFAVDNNYVINKLRLLFFPFIHKNWSLKYDQDNPVQPRYDINAPDLYIPTMGYITYVVVAGLMLGMQNRFSPEQLGIQASSALAYSIFELVIYSIIMYVVNISTNLKILDLVAFTGYKYVIIVFCIVTSILFHSFGYYVALVYSSLSLAVFLLRSLKTKVMQDPPPTTPGGGINYDPYGNPQQQQFDYSTMRKRKLYFLFLIAACQAFFSFLLSKHLYYVGLDNDNKDLKF